MTTVVLFWLLITVPDEDSIRLNEKVDTLDECFIEARRFLDHPPYLMLIEAGCAIILQPSEEH